MDVHTEQRFVITFPDSPGVSITLGYGFDGRLNLAYVEGSITDVQHEWLWVWLFPKTSTVDELMQQSVALSAKITVTPMTGDLSFQVFWDTYDNKVGKRARAAILWDALSDSEKVAALAAIKPYRYWLANNPGIAMLYPETFLSQRRWESNFKVKTLHK